MEQTPENAEQETGAHTATPERGRSVEGRLLLFALALAIVIGWVGLFLFYRPNETIGLIPKPESVSSREADPSSSHPLIEAATP